MYLRFNYHATLMCITMRLQTKDIASNNNLFHITDLFIQYRCLCRVTWFIHCFLNVDGNMEQGDGIYTVAAPFVSNACKRSVRDARNARENEKI